MILSAIWLLALAIGLLACGTLALQALLGRRWSPIAATTSVLAGGIYLLIGIEVGERVFSTDAGIALALKVGVGLLVALAVLTQFALVWWVLRERRPGWRRGCLAVLLIAQIAATCFTRWRFEEALSAMATRPFKERLSWEGIAGEALITDRGRQVPVFRVRAASPESVADDEHGPRRSQARSSSESFHSNCHGWVFTRGRYIIDERAVEMILADNGYFIVVDPTPGDIIVYRDQEGEIVHTGLVRAVEDGGVTWIESKWGIGRRYIHQPEDQGYSERFAYYRTERQPEWLKFRSRHLVKVRTEPARLVTSWPDAGADSTGSPDALRAEYLKAFPAWQNNDLPIGAE